MNISMSDYYIWVSLILVEIIVIAAPYVIVSRIINKILVKKLRDKREYCHLDEDEKKHMIHVDHFWIHLISYILIGMFITIPCYFKFLEILSNIVGQ